MNKLLKKCIAFFVLIQMICSSVFVVKAEEGQNPVVQEAKIQETEVQEAEIQETEIPETVVPTVEGIQEDEINATNYSLASLSRCVHDMEYGFDVTKTNTYTHTVTYQEWVRKPNGERELKTFEEPCSWTVVTTYAVYKCLDCGYEEGVPYASISTRHSSSHCPTLKY